MLRSRATTKTPVRITLTGGNDLIPYVQKYGGDAFSATIDKFIVVSLTRRNDGVVSLRYPDGYEKVDKIYKIGNPIIRQSLISHNFQGGLDLVSTAEIPLSSGLGSSGAFAVGLLNALHALNGKSKSSLELAEEAADLEINQLKYPIGKHDQYMAAFGGFLHLVFNKDGSVTVNRPRVSEKVKHRLEKEIVLVYSGLQRSASEILGVTAKRFENTPAVFEDIHVFRELGNRMQNLLVAEQVEEFAAGLRNLLETKKKCYVSCTNAKLESFIQTGYDLGAVGAKIVGAGGGGFVYFYVPMSKQDNFKKGIQSAGGTVFPFSFTEEGSRII